MDLPDHVAIIPDGNRRWAELRGVPPLEGHRRGAEVMQGVVECLIAHQVSYLTVWGFSADNWKRDRAEVFSLFDLLGLWIQKDTPWLHENGVRLKHIGRLHELPDTLQVRINKSVELTKDNTSMTLNLAFNYTGRTEIVDAAQRIVSDGVPPQNVDEHLFARYLYTDGTPDVDLVIRTAGEYRLSNFMLWQTAYSELFFSESLWPDFDARELEKALQSYSERKRRFGGD